MLIPKAEFVDTEAKARECLRYVMSHQDVGVDTETTGIRKMDDIVLFWSLATEDRRFCILADFLYVFEPFFEDEGINKHFTNHKFDRHMLANTGVPRVMGPTPCTLVLSWLLDENRRSHGLKQCVWDYFGRRMATFKEVFGKQVAAEKQAEEMLKILNDVEDGGREKAVDYASRDAWESLMLSQYLMQQLNQITMDEDESYTLLDHYWEVEEPFGRVLYAMERRGIMIDVDYLQEIKPGIVERVERARRKLNRMAGYPINLNSTPQLRALFFDKLGAMPRKFTAKKAPSTDKEVLGAWAEGNVQIWDGEHEIDIEAEGLEDDARAIQETAAAVLSFRKLDKFKGTYVDGLEPRVDKEYRLHTSLNHHGTVTGRLSSSGPNLQNIPRKDNDEFKIRDAFIADGGFVLYVSDYAQLEMRVMAHLSGDENMIEAIEKGVDLHSYTVSKMGMGASYEDVVAAKKADNPTPAQKKLLLLRQAAKAIGFGLIYGIGEVKLGRQLGLPIVIRVSKGKKRETCPEAAKLIKAYFTAFPRVKSFIKDTHNECKITGYVQTHMGRFRRLPTITSSNGEKASQARRQSVNTRVQGTAGDIVKAAMLLCENDERLKELGVRMLLQIHDELIFEIPDDEAVKAEAKEIIRHHMEHPFEEDFRVPLLAEGEYAIAWGEAK